MIVSLIVSLCLTIVIEIIISLLLGVRNKEDITVILWANILTNPIVVYIANCIKLLNNIYIYNIIIIVMETIVVIVEFVLYKEYFECKKKSPLLLSAVNNIISFLSGIIINKFIL